MKQPLIQHSLKVSESLNEITTDKLSTLYKLKFRLQKLKIKAWSAGVPNFTNPTRQSNPLRIYLHLCDFDENTSTEASTETTRNIYRIPTISGNLKTCNQHPASKSSINDDSPSIGSQRHPAPQKSTQEDAQQRNASQRWDISSSDTSSHQDPARFI